MADASASSGSVIGTFHCTYDTFYSSFSLLNIDSYQVELFILLFFVMDLLEISTLELTTMILNATKDDVEWRNMLSKLCWKYLFWYILWAV